MSDEGRTFDFVVPDFEVEAEPAERTRLGGDLGFERQALRLPFFSKKSKEVSVPEETIAEFWRDKVAGLAHTVTDAQEKDEARGFRVEEISFRIGVGVKGGLAFVAEGSVDASISVTLRRSG